MGSSNKNCETSNRPKGSSLSGWPRNDFGVGRRLKNLPALLQIGLDANRRVLQVEQLTHDCHIGAQAFDQLQKPAEVNGQHVSALPFGQERVQALLTVLVRFCLQPGGFRNRQLRPLSLIHI